MTQQTQKKSFQVEKVMITLYCLGVLLFGVWYVMNSKGGDIATVMAYLSGDRSMPMEALIYSCMLGLLFTITVTAGTGLSFLLLLLSGWKKKAFLVANMIVTAVLYALYQGAIVQATVHLSTNGMIQNITFWDMPVILEQVMKSKNVAINGLLLASVCIIPLVNRVQKQEGVNSTTI